MRLIEASKILAVQNMSEMSKNEKIALILHLSQLTGYSPNSLVDNLRDIVGLYTRLHPDMMSDLSTYLTTSAHKLALYNARRCYHILIETRRAAIQAA